MNRDSLDKLRHDRRLLLRRGWLSDKDRAAALDKLPDVSGKATTLGEASDEEDPADGNSVAAG